MAASRRDPPRLHSVFLIGFPAAAMGTNCFVIAPAAGQECVVVDPGIGVLDRLSEVLRQHRLKPAAVLLTHGHLDHTYSVTPVCGAHGVAARIHADDRHRLHDPYATLSPELLAMLTQQFGPADTWREPEDVVSITDGERLAVAGLDVSVLHAPGHTEGSVMFRIDDLPEAIPADQGLARTILAGDVLFSSGIGRTDLPGGSSEAMTASLRDVVLTQPDDALVLPGHGPATTIARERATNPYLQGLTA